MDGYKQPAENTYLVNFYMLLFVLYDRTCLCVSKPL